MDIPKVGSGPVQDWSNSPVDLVNGDNKVGGAPAPGAGAGTQTVVSGDNEPANAALAPKRAEASLDASAMKAKALNAIPINQPLTHKRDLETEAKAAVDAQTLLRDRAALHQGSPALKPFVGEHERAVQEAAEVFDVVPGAKIGRHIAEFVSGRDANLNPIDRREKSREISGEILAEGAGYLAGEAVGPVYEETIGAVAGKVAGKVGGEVAGHLSGDAAAHVVEKAAEHIRRDDK